MATSEKIKISKRIAGYMDRLMDDAGTIRHRLMSEFYQSRSTKYSADLNHAPFVILTNMRNELVELGFSKNAKAAITLDPTHPMTIQHRADRSARAEAQRKANEERAIADRERDERTEAILSEPATMEKVIAFIQRKYPDFPAKKLTNSEANSAAYATAMHLSDGRPMKIGRVRDYIQSL